MSASGPLMYEMSLAKINSSISGHCNNQCNFGGFFAISEEKSGGFSNFAL
jgi:hypothetical protein